MINLAASYTGEGESLKNRFSALPVDRHLAIAISGSEYLASLFQSRIEDLVN